MTDENTDTGGNSSRRKVFEPDSQVGRLGSMLSQVPTVLVLVALAAVGWWGHHTGWSAPSLAGLRNAETTVPQEDWCAEHNVPDSRCIKCHPELLGASKADWCKEHGVPESKCTLCHPEILKTGVAGDWCPEHQVPESSCTICHPEIAVKGKPPESQGAIRVTKMAGLATQPTLAATEGQAAPEDGSLGSSTRPASKRKDPKTCQTHAMRVQFASAEAVRKAGVRLGSVVERPMRCLIRAQSEVQYDRTRLVQVSPPVAGRMWRVDREVGDAVKSGEVLALVDSAEIGKAKAELLEQLAEVELKAKAHERIKASAQSGLRTNAELQEAAAAVRVAEIRLFNAQQALANLGLIRDPQEASGQMDEQRVRLLGLPPDLVGTLGPTKTANLIPVRVPFDGVIVSRDIVAGEMIETQKVLFTIADIRRMWVMIDIPQAQRAQIRKGQNVIFRPDGAVDQVFTGQITWISTSVDDETRTLRARAEVDNADGTLPAKVFGKSEVIIRETDRAVVVPNEAIQWEGCCHIVFVRLTDDIFQVRKIKLGARDDHFTEVTIGVLPGEVVAAGGSHVLKSEILKSALGAGCCAE